jgi:hypothetical protein
LQEVARLLVDYPQQFEITKSITLTNGVELSPLHVALAQRNAAAEEALISQGTQEWGNHGTP